MFAFIKRSRARRRLAMGLYDAIVAQARQPVFYANLGVPDTLDGRFEMIVLHTALLINRLRGQGPEAKAMSQSLFDHMLADMDSGLRLVGVADLRVAGKLKQMAKAFYGRALAYDEGLAAGAVALADAISRNVYGTIDTEPPAEWLQPMVVYVTQAAAALAKQPVDALIGGSVTFPLPPAVTQGPGAKAGS